MGHQLTWDDPPSEVQKLPQAPPLDAEAIHRFSKVASLLSNICGYLNSDTLPETNIAPENRPLEEEIPIGNHPFSGANC